MPAAQRRRTLLVALAALPVLAVGGSLVAAPGGAPPAGGAAAEESLSAFLADHPQLQNRRAMPIAFLREKLRATGGEGTAESLNGPAQEQYDNRAFPRTAVAPAQESQTKAAFSRSQQREKSNGELRQEGQGNPSKVVAGPWQPIGPSVGYVPGPVTYTGQPAYVSGRTTSIAMSHGTMYIGTAGGGVWKTADPMAPDPTWTHIGSDIPSTAIGTAYVAPDGSLYVGTGEQNGSGDSEAGVGLFRSTNGGATFTKLESSKFVGRGVGAILVDPTNPRHIYVGTTVARHGTSSVAGGRYTPPGVAPVGLYESTDGGASWTLALSQNSDAVNPNSATGDDFFRGGVTKILADPSRPGVVYAAMNSYGLFRRAAGGNWTAVYKIKQYGERAVSSSSRLDFDVTTLRGGTTRIYLGDATYYGDTTNGFTAGLVRTDDAGADSPVWTELSNPTPGTPGFGSYNFCQGQCWYDMVVTASPSDPDVVYLSGAMNYGEIFTAHQPSNGRAVVRSTDAGRHFTDMTNDVANNGLHPDHHALFVLPGGSAANETFFTASDGGMVRQSGPFVDKSADCDTRGLTGAALTDCKAWLSAIPTSNKDLNKGLETLQFQSASVRGSVVQAGTQDNGTWESDGPTGWFESVGGDGGQSAFGTTKGEEGSRTQDIRLHSYFAPQYDVNFRGNDPYGWNWISDPLFASGESWSFYTPLISDPRNAGYVYTGLQHVWRTTDNGGPQAYLEKHCNEFTGDFQANCGDWKALGGPAGDLSSSYWGSDYAGPANFVVAVERSAKDKGTMWAATRRGRLFISTNANAENPAQVRYTRLDKQLGLPTRFISGIFVDPTNANHVWLSYSGYSAYAPGGHVYEVWYDPEHGRGSVRDLSYDLGDQPVLDIVRAGNGALYVATDWGVQVLAPDSRSWAATNGLPKVATYGLTLSGSTLYAATHGRSIWTLKLG